MTAAENKAAIVCGQFLFMAKLPCLVALCMECNSTWWKIYVIWSFSCRFNLMPCSFNPTNIQESMTLYRFFCICLHQHEQRVHCTVSSSVVLSREGDRSLGLYCSTIHYYTLYTAFCSNAGWGHVFCFCCPSSSRQWRGRGLKTL